MVGLSTYFDKCSMLTVDGITEKILSCINFMGDVDKNVIYSDKYAICEYHYCSILKNRGTGRHNVLSCSGGMMRFGDDNQFFNPLTPFEIKFSEMVQMPMSAVELMGVDLEYYYAKDIRTNFAQDITNLNCTNDFKTCLTFTNATLCFGNTRDNAIVHSRQAVVWGVVTSLVLGSFVVFILMPRLRDRGMFYLLFTYIVPLLGFILIYAGLFLGPKIPFVMASVLVFMLFPIVFYSLRDVHKDSNKYNQVVLKEQVEDGNIKNVF